MDALKKLLGWRRSDNTIDHYLQSKTLLGLDLCVQGKFDEAEQHLRHVVKELEAYYGADHERTVVGETVLGATLLQQEKYNEAEKLLQHVVKIRETSAGADDIARINSKELLGRALCCQTGRDDKAEELFREVIQAQDKSLGPYHLNTMRCKALLGRVLLNQRRYHEAQELMENLMQRGGEYHNDWAGISEVRCLLGRILYEQKKYIEAEEMFRQAVQELESSSGPDNSETLAAKDLLRATRATLSKFGGYSEAEDRKGEEMLPDVVHRMEAVTAIIEDDYEETSKPLDLPRIPDQEWPLRAATEATAQQTLAGRLDFYFLHWQQDAAPYTDTAIREISVLLKQSNTQWSKVPRTYIVLRTIGSLDLLDRFIDIGFSDYWLPVTERGLPDCLRPSARAAFVSAQRLVLTKSLDLERGQYGQHCHFEQGESLPFDYQGRLGSGGYGQVDKVVSHSSFKAYALKRVRRNLAFKGQQRSAINQFISEIEILKRLQHQHVVEFVGSYTDPRYVGLLMSPVAETNLADYLGRATTSNRPELRTFFGCLARALEFLHANKIRHKDIKPSNILVDHGNVLYTDFGLSLDFEDAGHSTTISMVNGMTPRYCAPEVALQDRRNTTSDIWSLGVVFVEMTVVLKGKTTQDMDKFFECHGSELKYVRTNLTAFKEFTTELEGIGESTDNRAVHWAAQMLVVEQRERPTASELVTSITSPGEEGEASQFCGICCVSAEEDEFSDFSD